MLTTYITRFGKITLHGLLGSKRNWFGIGKSLSDLGFHVWLIDLRNHGESEWSDKHTYFDLAENGVIGILISIWQRTLKNFLKNRE